MDDNNNPKTGATELEKDQGNKQELQGAGSTAFKEYKTQAEYDKDCASIRHNATRAAEAEILKSLGLSPEDKGKLEELKKAYETTLSNEEKQSLLIQQLQAEVASYKAQLADNDYIVAALTKLSGKQPNEVDKIVRMAKGLKTESNTVAETIEEVVGLIGATKQPAAPTKPVGLDLNNPDPTPDVELNPFKAETRNMTHQAVLIRNDPEKAKRLAKEAGVNLNFL